MINSKEIILHDTSVGQRKKSESPTGIEPMASQNTGWALLFKISASGLFLKYS